MNSEQEEYESVALVKQEVFVYRIPPLTTNRGHKAVDWNLDAPDWTGRMRLVAVGKKKLELRLEDKASGNLFATCPVDEYPGGAIEPVTDSSRYFVVRLKDPNGRTAFIGLGFSDRGDSFDLNVALQDHFRYLEKAEAVSHAESHPEPALDLGFKQGQTITINLGGKKPSGSPARQRPPAASGNAPVPFLPPPPSAGSSVQRSSRTTANQSPKPSSTEPKTADLLPDF